VTCNARAGLLDTVAHFVFFLEAEGEEAANAAVASSAFM
jgi:hypothetical protein